MDANELRAQRKIKPQVLPHEAAYQSILQIIKTMAEDDITELLTPPIFSVEEAQYIQSKLIESNFKVSVGVSSEGARLQVNWE